MKYHVYLKLGTSRPAWALALSAGLACVFFMILGATHETAVLYSAPMVVLCLAWFCMLTLEEDSIVQQPELIVRRQLPFVIACLVTFALILYLML